MSVEKFQRPIVAPSFTPEPSTTSLANLATGTDGQIPIAATGGPTCYQSLSGDITVTKFGVTTVGAKKVVAAKMNVFLDSQVQGTGNPQNVAHGLGVVPAIVLVVPTDGGTVAYGVHTSTNVVFTGTVSDHFDVVALA